LSGGNAADAAAAQIGLRAGRDALVQLPEVLVDALLARMRRVLGETADGAAPGVVDA
jgi:hypothetical protein